MGNSQKTKPWVLADYEPVARFQVAVFDASGDEENSVFRHDGDPHLLARHVLRAAGQEPFRAAFTVALMEQFINNLNDN